MVSDLLYGVGILIAVPTCLLLLTFLIFLVVRVRRPEDAFCVFLWWFYFIPPLEKTPAWTLLLRCFGRLQDTDCSLWQAYGRGSYADKDMFRIVSQYLMSASPDDSEDIGLYNSRVFSLMADDDFKPGLSNQEMAAEFIRLYGIHPHVGIMQWEVAFAVWQKDPEFYTEHRRRILAIWPENKDYFTTYDVKSLSVRFMRKMGLSQPLEVAHGGMLCRCLPTIWKCGARPIPHRMKVSYDPTSVQIWTRNRWLWWFREYIGRCLIYPIKGWVRLLPPPK